MTQKIAIFASGTGTNAEKMMEHFQGNAAIRIALLLTNNPKAGAIERAKRFRVPVLVFNRKQFGEPSFLVGSLREQDIDWIVLAGFLWKIPEFLIDAFPKRIINIHPALLPKFGGKGMYGAHVHQAVIAQKEKESGITIHFVNKNYDEGEIILQKKCIISPADTPEELASKIHRLEHRWFSPTVEAIIQGGLLTGQAEV